MLTALLLLACPSPPPAAPDAPAPEPPAERPAAPAEAPPDHDWTTGVVEVAKAEGTSTLRDVRFGRHDGYERVVFEFADAVPGYHVEYIDKPARRCASDAPVDDMPGDAWLRVRLRPAQAHTGDGEATVTDRDRALDGALGKRLVLTCDFEGEVAWVLALTAPNRYRVDVLADPPRLVVDVAAN